jgi:hypothetical protein
MTLIAAFFLAIIAGWIVREPRRAAATVVLPYLAMVAVQTWSLANGYGINPPDTVTPLSGAVSYYVVQLVFGLTTVAIAAELAVVRRYAAARRGEPADSPATSWHQTAVAAAVCATGTLVLLVAYLSNVKLVSHHSTSGGTPLQGTIGIGLSLIGFLVLGVAAIRAIRAQRRAAALSPAAEPSPTATAR